MNLYYKSSKKYRTVTTIDINLHQCRFNRQSYKKGQKEI